MENGNISQGEGKDPSSFLSDIIGNPVTVKLNSGVVYKGTRPAPIVVAQTVCYKDRHAHFLFLVLQASSSLLMAT
jgi:hypothetical protein